MRSLTDDGDVEHGGLDDVDEAGSVEDGRPYQGPIRVLLSSVCRSHLVQEKVGFTCFPILSWNGLLYEIICLRSCSRLVRLPSCGSLRPDLDHLPLCLLISCCDRLVHSPCYGLSRPDSDHLPRRLLELLCLARLTHAPSCHLLCSGLTAHWASAHSTASS